MNKFVASVPTLDLHKTPRSQDESARAKTVLSAREVPESAATVCSRD